jgi:GNAT superfamily N-acetyltransferase
MDAFDGQINEGTVGRPSAEQIKASKQASAERRAASLEKARREEREKKLAVQRRMDERNAELAERQARERDEYISAKIQLPSGGYLWMMDGSPYSDIYWRYQALGALRAPMMEAYGKELTKEYMQQFEGAVIIPGEGDEIIACALLKREGGYHVQARNEMVLPGYQGQGYGTRLLQAIHEAAPKFLKKLELSKGSEAFKKMTREKKLNLQVFVDKTKLDWHGTWLEKHGYTMHKRWYEDVEFHMPFDNPFYKEKHEG